MPKRPAVERPRAPQYQCLIVVRGDLAEGRRLAQRFLDSLAESGHAVQSAHIDAVGGRAGYRAPRIPT